MALNTGMTRLAEQLLNLLQSISVADYQAPLTVLDGASIGQHVRHIVDFFTCLEKGVAAGVVDYALRQREPEIESNPDCANRVLKAALAQLLLVPNSLPLAMKGDFLGVQEAQRPLFQSSLGRELTFVHDHAVHHMAMIKIGLSSRCPELLSNADFGVAPSTIKYRSTQSF